MKQKYISPVMKTTESVSSFIEGFTQVYTDDGNEYFYVPYWFLKQGVNKYEILSFDKLPNDLENCIKNRDHEKK